MPTGKWKIKRREPVSFVSALGCKYKSSREENEFGEVVEHIELWVEEEEE